MFVESLLWHHSDAHFRLQESWDKFKTYPYHVLYATLMHPAFLRHGRIVLNHTAVMLTLGYVVSLIHRSLVDFPSPR